MLLPIQTSGSKPPLFFVHGLYGVMCLGPTFARTFGPDQPLYVINADGIDGTRAPIDDLPQMVRGYVEEIQQTCPAGPIRVGAMCSGCFAAVEIARSLQAQGRETGPVILADPPPMPPGVAAQNRRVDRGNPRIERQLYQQAERALLEHATRPYNAMPFEATDPGELHLATLAGLSSLVAFAHYVPKPFSGSAALIVSAERAPGFFHPQMPWHKLLPGPRLVHVLPWHHQDLFRSGREAVARSLKFMLEEAAAFEIVTESQEERISA